MEQDKHYFFVGSFVLAAVVAILTFSVWISSATKGNFIKYRARFTESVSGLSVGNAVKYRGVSVGMVESISIDQTDTRLINVIINVDEETPIKTDTLASLKLQGVTGLVFIELSGGSNESQNLKDTVKRGKIADIQVKSSPLNAIMDRVPELLDKISNGIERLNSLVSPDNINAISGIINNWQQMSVSLSDDLKQIRPILDNTNKVSRDLRDITSTSKSSINETLDNLNRSSGQLNVLLRDLRKTSRSISNVSETIEENPSSLIFPGKEKGVKAP